MLNEVFVPGDDKIFSLGQVDNGTVDHSPTMEALFSPVAAVPKDIVAGLTADFYTPDRNNTGEEASLIMHYFDKAFYIQFPFYDHPSGERDRGWIFKLTLKGPTFYATLAISQLDHRSTRVVQRGSQTLALKGKIDYYAIALCELNPILKNLQVASGLAGLVDSIQALACMLQLIFFEVCSSRYVLAIVWNPIDLP